MTTTRPTATKAANIAEIETLIRDYNAGAHSQEREYAARKMMLMADDILNKLKGVAIAGRSGLFDAGSAER